MCEIVAVAWEEPRPFGRILPLVEEVEHLGVASFGWGVAWRTVDGGIDVRKSVGTLREDREEVAPELPDLASDRFLVHLRRPSRLSTIQLADTQPFLGDGFAFCHNGGFLRHLEHRPAYEDRLEGAADSEVGFRLFEELYRDSGDAGEAMAQTHRRLSGNANLGFLRADGALAVYAGHEDNAVWRFRWDDATIVSTALHSDDRSLFDLVFTEAKDPEPVASGTGVALVPPR